MRSLVTGATGFLGEELTRSLAEAHGAESVTALVRDPVPEAELAAAERLEGLGVRLVPVDLFALPAGNFTGIEFDVLYHLAAETDSAASASRLEVNTAGTENLLETLGRDALSGSRVVFAGATAAVDRARRPRGLMKETDPEAPRTEYGRSKLRAEKILAGYAEDYGFDFAIPRFSPVWTPDLSTGFLKAFKEQAVGKSIMRLVGWPGRITMIRREDAAAILRHLGETDVGDGKAVHVGDGNVYRYRDLMRDIRRIAGQRGWFLPVPGFVWWMVRFAAWLPFFRNFAPWRLSCLLGADLAVDTTLLRSLYPHPMKGWEESKSEIDLGISPPGP